MSGPLSFEHVPPAAAFNDHPVVQLGWDEIAGTHPDDLQSKKGRVSQRGAGAYRLCVSCNNLTGHWYGSAYAHWAHQGVLLIQHAKSAPTLYHIFHTFPLRVIKQIFCMFFSANPPGFAQGHQDLVRFVLNRDFRYANPSLRVFVYFNAAAMSRQSSITGRVNLQKQRSDVYSEIAFPPFGYVLSVDGNSPDINLVDISHFSHYSYNEWADVALRLPVHHIYTPYPGDFRSRKQVLSEAGNAGRT